ncbi:MAG: methionyl-tRNA formyltransferase [Bacilli bacterium]|jgi:methionyl-tRNA formyltransferase
MEKVRIIFMGTPKFATTVFQGLIDANYQIIALISQPDRPVGRKQIVKPTPTKAIALANNIPVYQPEKIRHDYAFVKDLKPDLIVTCAYGQIIPQALLDIPRLGCINVHASLLPKLRGGAPIQRAIMEGLDKTGVTIMEMIDKMDAGKMYLQAETPINDDDDYASLAARLEVLGRDLLLKFLPLYLEGKIQGKVQNEEEVTFAWNIKKEEEEIDWRKDARTIFNHIRALSPKPGAYSLLNGDIFKIYQSEVVENESLNNPGSILKCHKELVVACGKGSLRLLEVQPAGKKSMTASQYVNGFKRQLENNRFRRVEEKV